MNKLIISLFFLMTGIMVLNGCVSQKEYDYTEFNLSKPKSILVLMPLNQSKEVNASNAVISQITYPLAEAGYYVFPVIVANEIFKQNGLTTANDIQAVSIKKLHQIFNNDAVLYLNIKDYGASYQILQSDTRVTLEAKLVDAKNGKLLWQGKSTASSLEQQNQNNNNLFGSLLIAVIDQIGSSITDKSYDMAGLAAQRLLSPTPSKHNGILPGPRYINQ